ncbi:MAG: (2E,6E)-farnesyl diphosphate synthase [Pseudohongiellaceae bacterium]|nr:(2E,6E)-farnesyl diphosphate synthase [Pseudohongiellaceae bacterium]
MPSADTFNLSDYMARCQARVEAELEQRLDALPGHSLQLKSALQYACLQGGKRVRPVLVYAASKAFGASPEQADLAACAVEMIHCYSLVHDDLPAMDDDALRRGKPTVHIAYDEATAILAGDALQPLAFQLLSSPLDTSISPEQKLRMLNYLSTAAGIDGMVGGQAIDFESVGKTLSLEQLQTMHSLKTGALIKASVILGALCAQNIEAAHMSALSDYADAIGLAFQVQDDILDVISDTETLGKAQGADQALDKPTYVALLGLDGATHKAQELCKQAIEAIDCLGQEAVALREIAQYIVGRKH